MSSYDLHGYDVSLVRKFPVEEPLHYEKRLLRIESIGNNATNIFTLSEMENSQLPDGKLHSKPYRISVFSLQAYGNGGDCKLQSSTEIDLCANEKKSINILLNGSSLILIIKLLFQRCRIKTKTVFTEHSSKCITEHSNGELFFKLYEPLFTQQLMWS